MDGTAAQRVPLSTLMLPLLALSALTRMAPAIVAPNTSLATTPIAYFVRALVSASMAVLAALARGRT